MMKKVTLLFLVMIVLAGAVHAQGLISGRIIDQNKTGLPGASVFIKKLSKTTISDETGRYRMLNVPAGSYTLEISYVGYNTIEKEIVVKKSQVVALDVEMAGVKQLKDVVINGSTGAALKALNQQRTSNRIVNVISADQIGRFPDPNIGDALKRVPGIYVQVDQGEASLVSVRGTDPSKTTININGSNISSTGDNRAVGINAIPSDMVQAVEVTKAITPDMDGDAIGGVINLITRKAPYKKLLSITAGPGYSFLVNKAAYNGNIVFGDRFLKDKKLGIIASASLYRQFLGSNSHGGDWADTKWVDGNTYFMPRYLTIDQTVVERMRQSYTLGVDYKINEKHLLTLTGIYNDYKDWRQHYSLKVDDIGYEYPTNWKRAAGYERTTAKGKAVKDANLDLIDDVTKQTYVDVTNDHLHPQYDPELERHIDGGNNSRNAALNAQKIINIGLEGQHIFGKVKVEWKASYLKNTTKLPDSRNLELESEMEKTVQMNYTDSRFIKANNGFGIDNILKNLEGRATQNSDTVDTWYLDSYYGANKVSYTRQYLAQLDITVPLWSGKHANTIKFGAKYRGMNKENTTLSRVNWLPNIDPARKAEYDQKVAAGQTVNIEDYRDWKRFWTGFANNMQDVSSTIFGRSNYTVGSTVTTQWVSHQNLGYNGNTDEYIKIKDAADVLAANYSGSEGIAAGYVMSTQQFGNKLSMIFGTRVEQTKLRYEGYNYNKRLDAIGTKNVSTTNVLDFMPTYHIKYTPNQKMVYRFAYTRTISRPAYVDIAPKMNVSIKDKTVSEGNPDLKPTLSNNLDLLGEYYTGGTGLISAGVYFKNITNYTATIKDNVKFAEVEKFVTTPEELVAQGAVAATVTDYKKYYDPLKKNNESLTRTKPVNASSAANLLGFELAFQQKLYFLPKPFSNFSLYANYTHNWIFVEDGQPKLPGTANNVANISLAYEVTKFNARVSFNHTSAFSTITGNLANGKGDIYFDKVYYVDANVNYFVTPKLVVYMSANNLLNQAQRTYIYQPEFTYANLITGTTGQLGVKVNVF